jgi:hypothetical protein
LDLPADEIHYDLGIALIRNVYALEPGPHAEIFHRQVARVAAPATPGVDQRLLLSRLGIGNELGHRIDRDGWMHNKGE